MVFLVADVRDSNYVLNYGALLDILFFDHFEQEHNTIMTLDFKHNLPITELMLAVLVWISYVCTVAA
jgi:hypothetical protein